MHCSTGHCRLLRCEEPSSVYISWIFVSTAVWLLGVFAIRYTLKALLSYHGWMYESRGKISLLTKLWLVVVLQLLIEQSSIVSNKSDNLSCLTKTYICASRCKTLVIYYLIALFVLMFCLRSVMLIILKYSNWFKHIYLTDWLPRLLIVEGCLHNCDTM